MLASFLTSTLMFFALGQTAESIPVVNFRSIGFSVVRRPFDNTVFVRSWRFAKSSNAVPARHQRLHAKRDPGSLVHRDTLTSRSHALLQSRSSASSEEYHPKLLSRNSDRDSDSDDDKNPRDSKHSDSDDDKKSRDSKYSDSDDDKKSSDSSSSSESDKGDKSGGGLGSILSGMGGGDKSGGPTSMLSGMNPMGGGDKSGGPTSMLSGMNPMGGGDKSEGPTSMLKGINPMGGGGGPTSMLSGMMPM